jgi:uncharacterized membrane protein HdeD (DUF308 family)
MLHTMDANTLEWILRIWAVSALAGGITIIILNVGQTIAVIGVLLIIAGIVSIIPAFLSYAGEWEFDFVE